MPESSDEAVRELIFQSYRIIYRVGEDEISIAMVIHAARDLDAIKPKPDEVQ
jgi:toxin ParE1/3/4